MKMIRYLALVIIVLGIAGIVIGGVFVGEGMAKNNLIVNRMNVEKVTLTITNADNTTQTIRVNNMSDAQKAADKIATDRRQIAPTYQDLLAMSNGRFDPTNPQEISYAQAMNLENYLYTAVTAFGLIQVTMAAGGFMIITGLAVGGVGFVLYRVSRTKEA
ncbi:MAG: hypothetical protein ABR886_07330 [Dehalococcoidales bacterium]|jgi:hypothetical protein